MPKNLVTPLENEIIALKNVQDVKFRRIYLLSAPGPFRKSQSILWNFSKWSVLQKTVFCISVKFGHLELQVFHPRVTIRIRTLRSEYLAFFFQLTFFMHYTYIFVMYLLVYSFKDYDEQKKIELGTIMMLSCRNFWWNWNMVFNIILPRMRTVFALSSFTFFQFSIELYFHFLL